MVALPRGVLTFAFTDIEGSTRLLRELGEAYDDVAAVHDALLREVWQRHGVTEVSTEGDAFFLVHDDTDSMLAAVAAAQRAIAGTDWPHGVTVRIRVGVHVGYAVPSGDNYRALAVHRAARVVDAANGGQTYLTTDVVERGRPCAGTTLRSLGRFQVRDFDGPVELWSLDVDGVPTDPRPPRVRPADRHNLVPPATSLVGRRADIERVGAALRPGSIVTVVGPGGIGKTRLAVETALTVIDRWADGAWFVDLSAIIDPALVAPAVATAVGAPVGADGDTAAEVVEHLRDRRLVVLLDNCEQVVAGAARWAADVVRQCPGVAVLATSRTPLGVRAEVVERIGQLDTTRGGSASELFVERAGRAGAEASADDVAELCAELDGLPLAIEMAAARAGVLTPADIVAQIRRSPSGLASRDPTLPERQRSLDRLFEWSHDLLDRDARELLGLLTGFAGGFGLDEVEHLVAGHRLEPTALESLLTLVDSSFVQIEQAAGSTRFRLFDTVRRAAMARCSPAERDDAVRRLAQVLLRAVGPERAFAAGWMSEVELELDNVRGVIDPLVERRLDDETAYALACTLGRFHDRADTFRIGIVEAGRVLVRLDTPSPGRVGLLSVQADLLLRIDELAAARAALDEAASLAVSVGRPTWDEGCVERSLGELLVRQGDPAAAAAVVEEALARPLSDRSAFRLLSSLGVARYSQGDSAGALEAFEREARICEAHGLDGPLAMTYGNLATVLTAVGEVERAALEQERCLELSRSLGMRVGTAFSMIVAGQLAARSGRAEQAVVLRAAGLRQLDDLAYVLYPEDRAALEREDLELRAQLDAEQYAVAADSGAALATDDAADLAASVLRELAATRAGVA